MSKKINYQYKKYLRLNYVFLQKISTKIVKKFNSNKWLRYKKFLKKLTRYRTTFLIRKLIFLNFCENNNIYVNSLFNLLSTHKFLRLKNEYKNNLFSKQKLQFFYKIKYYQIKKFFSKFKSNDICYFLEQRFDLMLYRSGFFFSILFIRQLSLHKRLFVNSNIVKKFNFLLKIGDLVEFFYGLNVNFLHVKKRKIILLLFKILKNFKNLNSYKIKKIISKKYHLKGKIHFQKEYQFYYLNNNLFSNHLEINYKTLSFVVLSFVNFEKYFFKWINFFSINNYILKN